MKKQFLFIAVISSAILMSCSKEKTDTPQPDSLDNSISVKPIVLDPLSVGLSARYEFNNTLKDTTKHLSDAVSTVNRVIFTTDRKGVANRAIRFNEAYGLNISAVPLDTATSVSVWVKTDMFPTSFVTSMLEGPQSIGFSQFENHFQAGTFNGIAGQYVISPAMDNNWHHLAATFDNTSLKYYIDGNYIGSSPTPAGWTLQIPTTDYFVGYGYNLGYKYWKGSMDDLRFYKRLLTPTEINKLAHL